LKYLQKSEGKISDEGGGFADQKHAVALLFMLQDAILGCLKLTCQGEKSKLQNESHISSEFPVEPLLGHMHQIRG
jgi:hypothetical protein